MTGWPGSPAVYVGAVTVIAGWTVSTLSGIEVAPVAPTTPTLSATRYSRLKLPWVLMVAMLVVALAFVHVWPLSVETWRGHTAAGWSLASVTCGAVRYHPLCRWAAPG